ncbi:MAG: hypothetical protein KC708_00305 [Anaerolineae bacterium]|nr:hypothetical protein [Anaerolineae bacterium]
MTANVEGMIRAGVDAYRAGNKTEARVLLEKAIELDDYNEEAWLWLSAVVDTKEEQRTCLENVLVINPDNERARNGIAALGRAEPEPEPEPENPFSSTDTELPFADFNFDADVDNTFDISDNAATSQPQWDDSIATSSASSTFQPKELSANEYDSWVDSLNLGTSPVPGSAPQPSSVFTDDTPEAIDVFGSATAETNAAFSSFDIDSFDDSSFDDSRFDDDAFGNSAFSATPPPAATAPPPVSPSVMSPVGNDFLDDFDTDLDADDVFGDDDLTDLSQVDTIDKLSDPSGADFLFDDEDEAEEDDPQEMFRLIPPSVKPTRLPGTVESASGMLKVGVALLAILNLAAIGAIVVQLVA